jgi:large subunit ribosomal protein L6
MSRIGNQSIEIPKGVTVTITPKAITAKGPKGSLTLDRHAAIEVKEEKGELVFTRKGNDKPTKAAHGLMRALTANLVTGVTKGFERQLEINGVGYRAEVAGDTMTMALGYSHPVVFKLPKGVTAKVEKNRITLASADRDLVGQTAAKVRELRSPEPYKGKGVKYVEEVIKKKVGKAGATGSGGG